VRDEVSDWIGDKTQYKAHYKHESEQGYFLFAYNHFFQNIQIDHTETRGSPGFRSFLSYNGSISNVVCEKIFEIQNKKNFCTIESWILKQTLGL
jgi:hypothetical protein